MSEYTDWTRGLHRQRPYDVIADALAGELGPNAQHYASTATSELLPPDGGVLGDDEALDQQVLARMLDLAREDEDDLG